MDSTNSLKKEYDEHQCWGMVASIDLYDCHPQYIKTPEKIQELIDGLINSIGMKKFGNSQIQRFAEGALEGYSALQFIETSSITMHFDDQLDNRAFIDIFSCKYFDHQKAELFCRQFLKGQKSKSIYYFRH